MFELEARETLLKVFRQGRSALGAVRFGIVQNLDDLIAPPFEFHRERGHKGPR